jgi:DNA replication protein DnaC
MGVMDRLTFAAYKPQEPWQAKALDTVQRWVADVQAGGKPWLVALGAVGSGKTHLCTAACADLLNSGHGVRYMLWPEESRQLKACVTDAESFGELLYPLQKAEILYIDDLFKTQRGADTGRITPADIKVACELLDSRCRNNRPTIISSEWLMDELLDMDEGVFSRVYQMSRGYKVQIARDKGRNIRLKEGQYGV